MNIIIIFLVFYMINVAQSLCLPYHYYNVTAVRCDNITDWSNEPEEFQMDGKTFMITNYAPQQIWLNKDLEVIGMSSKNRTIYLMESNLTSNDTSTVLNRLLNGEFIKQPEEKRVWKKPLTLEDVDSTLYKMLTKEQASTSYCDYHSYIMEHIFDHVNVLDWCNDLFFGPNEKYRTRHSKKRFNQLIKEDIRELYFRHARYFCEWEECQLLLKCNDGDERVTYPVNMLQDISKNPKPVLKNCTRWNGIEVNTTDYEWYSSRYLKDPEKYKKWLDEEKSGVPLKTRTLF